MAEKKWMQKAFAKNKGALHRMLGVPLGETIPMGMMTRAAKAGGKKGMRARAALNARRVNKKRKSRVRYRGKG